LLESPLGRIVGLEPLPRRLVVRWSIRVRDRRFVSGWFHLLGAIGHMACRLCSVRVRDRFDDQRPERSSGRPS
jgi:hypothetical protein